MMVTYIKERDKYVDSAGRQVTTSSYGKDFYNCQHDFQDTGRRGHAPGGNGKGVYSAAYQCTKCSVFMVVELKK